MEPYSKTGALEMRRLAKIGLVATGLAAAIAASGAIILYSAFGGGQPYADLSTAPLLPDGTIEAAVISERPIGNVAVSANGRIFYTIHPESNPKPPFLYEWKNGSAVAYPDAEGTAGGLLQTPLGVSIDRKNRLWVIDPGTHGFGQPRLIAIDLANNQVVKNFAFGSDIAPLGSFLQDAQISPDGQTIIIADVGFWAKRPALIVVDAETGQATRRLERHASVYPQNILIRNQIRDMKFLGGLLEMKTGVDGITISRDGQWLYYAAMNHDTIYRVPMAVIASKTASEADIEAAIEPVSKKPLNDGLSSDNEGNVYITDIEHQGVAVLRPNGKLETLVKDKRVRWADDLTFGPDGWLYLADSAIPELVLQIAVHHAEKGPYTIWRFEPGGTASAGQ
jgi:sugar lactone lactonase YvrE